MDIERLLVRLETQAVELDRKDRAMEEQKAVIEQLKQELKMKEADLKRIRQKVYDAVYDMREIKNPCETCMHRNKTEYELQCEHCIDSDHWMWRGQLGEI